MNRCLSPLLAACLTLATDLAGQAAPPTDEVHRAAFDYLLGDWEFTGERLSGTGRVKFRGYWTATRTPDNHALIDEYRVVDETGKTSYVTTTLRVFNPAARQWRIVSIERSGTLAEGKAWKDGDEIRIEQSYGGPLLRFRYYDIRPDRFSWVGSGPDQSGSYRDFQWIEARRVGPHRPGTLATR